MKYCIRDYLSQLLRKEDKLLLKRLSKLKKAIRQKNYKKEKYWINRTFMLDGLHIHLIAYRYLCNYLKDEELCYFINKYNNMIEWSLLSRHDRKILIEKFKHKIDWRAFCVFNHLTEEFICKYIDYIKPEYLKLNIRNSKKWHNFSKADLYLLKIKHDI